ncbi:Leucine rich repeat protein [Trachipleistophora hominis]|uniref:Leucine rich repeat protein n=1 Tax=Trachipleistophora hominis TaxID=72359 RepID=L7JXK0_TRAHO|nr:Leucine rich repeat protein [Trachipleistophora hominis]
MHVNAATIYTTMNIDERIEIVIFNNVNVVEGSTIVFNNNCKQLEIVKSEGSFDLRPYIGIKYYFGYFTELKILPGKKSFPNLSSIKLRLFHFMQTVKLPNIYELIELECISTTEDTEIILNKACKELRIESCEGVINGQEIEYLESLHINFFRNEKDNIRFIGSIRVNKIYITNICWGTFSIISMLTNFKNIQYIEFKDKSLLMFLCYPKYLYNSVIRCITRKKGSKDNSDLLSKLLATTNRDSNTWLEEVLNIILNFVLRNIMGKGVMDNISELELGHFFIDQDNCKSLKELKNLKILRIRTRKITNEFFYNLPPNLILLDITNFAEGEIIDAEKYTIKSSIIVPQHQNIKILSVNVDFLYNVRYLSVMMPSLDILVVQYSRSITDYFPMQKSKIKVRELLITCNYTNEIMLQEEEMILFIKNIKFYIDFELLKYIEFVSLPVSVFFNPDTFQVIE